jgi:hypothetical protein
VECTWRAVDLPKLERVQEPVLLTLHQVDKLAGVIDARYRALVLTTLSVYGHLFPGVDERVDGFLEATFEGAGENAADRSRTNRAFSGS